MSSKKIFYTPLLKIAGKNKHKNIKNNHETPENHSDFARP